MMLRAGARGDRDDALPARRRRSLLPRGRLRGVEGSAPGLRARPASRPERRDLRALCRALGRPSRPPREQRRQTVRRPPAFYAHLLDGEVASAPRSSRRRSRACCARHEELEGSARRRTLACPPRRTAHDGVRASSRWGRGPLRGRHLGPRRRSRRCRAPTTTPPNAARSSPRAGRRRSPAGRPPPPEQLAAHPGRGPTAEMLEVQLVNAVAPFILCASSRP